MKSLLARKLEWEFGRLCSDSYVIKDVHIRQSEDSGIRLTQSWFGGNVPSARFRFQTAIRRRRTPDQVRRDLFTCLSSPSHWLWTVGVSLPLDNDFSRHLLSLSHVHVFILQERRRCILFCDWLKERKRQVLGGDASVEPSEH